MPKKSEKKYKSWEVDLGQLYDALEVEGLALVMQQEKVDHIKNAIRVIVDGRLINPPKRKRKKKR